MARFLKAGRYLINEDKIRYMEIIEGNLYVYLMGYATTMAACDEIGFDHDRNTEYIILSGREATELLSKLDVY